MFNGIINYIKNNYDNVTFTHLYNTVNLFHMFIVAVILFFIGLYKKETPSYIIWILLTLSCLIPFLVGFPNLSILTSRTIVRLLHWLIAVMFIVFCIIYLKDPENITDGVYNSFIWLSIIIFVYHLYKLYNRYKKIIYSK